MVFSEEFEGSDLDATVWLPHYLPAWSSRAASAATYELRDSCLRLFVNADAPLWCPESHPDPLRVSGIASASWSGPVGSSRGQQPFRPQLLVSEAQPRFEGWLLQEASVAVRCRMNLADHSMGAMWLAGFEDDPSDSGELCVVEVFGRSVRGRSAEVGVGVKRKQDHRLIEDFTAQRLEIDVSEFHEYAVSWRANGAEFSVDGEIVHRSTAAPSYPMQIMLAAFDFPAWRNDNEKFSAEIEVDWVRVTRERACPESVEVIRW